jgi:hypothetical protein
LVGGVDIDTAFLIGGVLVVITALIGAIDVHLAYLDGRIDIVQCRGHARPGNEGSAEGQLKLPRGWLNHTDDPRGAHLASIGGFRRAYPRDGGQFGFALSLIGVNSV